MVAAADGCGARMYELELRRDQRLPDEPFRKALQFALEKLRRRIRERVEAVPAADLDLAELRVIEGLPRNMRETAQRGVAPAQDLEVVLRRVVAKPVDEFIVGDARFAHRRPDFD